MLALPNAARDVTADGARPGLIVTGCPTRVVVARRTAAMCSPTRSSMDAAPSRCHGAPSASSSRRPAMRCAGPLARGLAQRDDPAVRRLGHRARRRRHRARRRVDGCRDATTVTGPAGPRRPSWSTARPRVDDPLRSTRPASTSSWSSSTIPGAEPTAGGRRLVLGLDGAQPGGRRRRPPVAADGAGDREPHDARVPRRARRRPGGAVAAPIAVTVASGTGWHLVGVLARHRRRRPTWWARSGGRGLRLGARHRGDRPGRGRRCAGSRCPAPTATRAGEERPAKKQPAKKPTPPRSRPPSRRGVADDGRARARSCCTASSSRR